MMRRLPRSVLIAALLEAIAEPPDEAVLVVRRSEPHPADALSLPFRDNEKIRAAEEKRARRARKRLGLPKP